MNRTRKLTLQKTHIHYMNLRQLEEINSKLGAILLILTKKIGEDGGRR